MTEDTEPSIGDLFQLMTNMNKKLDEITAVIDTQPTLACIEAVRNDIGALKMSVRAEALTMRKDVRQIAAAQRDTKSRLDRADIPT